MATIFAHACAILFFFCGFVLWICAMCAGAAAAAVTAGVMPGVRTAEHSSPLYV